MDNQSAQNPHPTGHEPIETDVRAVWRTGAVLAGVVLGSYLLVLGLLKWFAATEGGPPANQQAKTDPNWDRQNPLHRLRIQETQLLHEYQWIDASTGLARIPVDRAVEIISQQGLPPTLQAPASAAATLNRQQAEPATESPPADTNQP